MKNLLIICLSVITLGASAQTNGNDESSPSQKEYSKKINSLTDQLVVGGDNVDLYVQRAEQIYYLNAIYPHQTVSQFKLRDALVDINKAIQLDGKNPRLYSIRGMYKRNITGDLAGAREDLTKAIELDPENPIWYLQRTNYSKVDIACSDWKVCEEMGNDVCKEIHTSLCAK